MEGGKDVNILVLIPLVVLAIPIIPAFIEIFRRKDKGPREIPEQTLYEDRSEASKPIPMLERTRAEARVKIAGEMIRIVGDVSIPDGLEIKENIVVHGNLKIGSKCHIHGSIKAFGEVEVGEESVVEGHIISERKVTIRRNAKVNGIVDSAKNIILEENAVVEAVSAEKSVKLARGAKINRKISEGISITAAPSTVPASITEKPPLPEREEARGVGESARIVPSFEERVEEIIDEKSRLFKSLQDRIRSLESFKAREIDETRLKDLTPREVEIYKLAISGCDVSEIGLRLFMDLVQVQEVINSLIKRHYLDERLKPVTPKKAERVAEEAPGTVQQKEPELEGAPINEVFEKMLASKLRIEVKKRLKSAEEEPAKEVKEADGKSTSKIEIEDILKEWRRASSLLFGHDETEKENPSDATDALEQFEEDDQEISDTVEEGAQEKETEDVTK